MDANDIADMMEPDVDDILSGAHHTEAVKENTNSGVFAPIVESLQESAATCLGMISMLNKMSSRDKYSAVLSESMYSCGYRDDVEELKILLNEMKDKWLDIIDGSIDMIDVIEEQQE